MNQQTAIVERNWETTKPYLHNARKVLNSEFPDERLLIIRVLDDYVETDLTSVSPDEFIKDMRCAIQDCIEIRELLHNLAKQLKESLVIRYDVNKILRLKPKFDLFYEYYQGMNELFQTTIPYPRYSSFELVIGHCLAEALYSQNRYDEVVIVLRKNTIKRMEYIKAGLSLKDDDTFLKQLDEKYNKFLRRFNEECEDEIGSDRYFYELDDAEDDHFIKYYDYFRCTEIGEKGFLLCERYRNYG